jgi:hypothetical protein
MSPLLCSCSRQVESKIGLDDTEFNAAMADNGTQPSMEGLLLLHSTFPSISGQGKKLLSTGVFKKLM